jgi:hypothetical protein
LLQGTECNDPTDTFFFMYGLTKYSLITPVSNTDKISVLKVDSRVACGFSRANSCKLWFVLPLLVNSASSLLVSGVKSPVRPRFNALPRKVYRRLSQSLAVALVQAANDSGAIDWCRTRHIVLLGVWVRDAVLLVLMDGLP